MRFMQGDIRERWAILYVLTHYYHKKGHKIVPSKLLAQSLSEPDIANPVFKRIIRANLHKMKRYGFVKTHRIITPTAIELGVQNCDNLRLS